MLGKVERDMADKLENGDWKQAMQRLRAPPIGEPRHSPYIALRIGLWTLLLAILLATCAIIIPHIFSYNKAVIAVDDLAGVEDTFWEVTIRMYRGIFLFSLMILLLGFNIYGWAASGINHAAIFELDPDDHLSSLHLIEDGIALLVLCATSLTIWLFQFYLAATMGVSPNLIRYISFAFLLILLLGLFNPIPIFMYSSRIFLLKCLFRIITAPFHHVHFADFFLADQFTSLVPVFQDLLFIVCTCSLTFNPDTIAHVCDRRFFAFSSVIACLPFWFRLAQCLRRFYDTGKAHPHLTNAGKYLSSLVVILFASLHVAYESRWYWNEVSNVKPPMLSGAINNTNTTSNHTVIALESNFLADNGYLYYWIVACVVSTVYNFIWDVKMDWGLFDMSAGQGRKLLRPYLVYRRKWYYYSAILADLILRSSWTITVSEVHISEKEYVTHTYITLLIFLEMFRRFIWNFFRLECEHVNNVNQRDIEAARVGYEDDKSSGLDSRGSSKTQETSALIPMNDSGVSDECYQNNSGL